MARIFASVAHESRRKPLATCIASLVALSAPATSLAAPSWPVTSCLDDGGPNTLRSVINAGTTFAGDTISLEGLTGANACPGSTITLATGAIGIPQASLTILGPGSETLQIDASNLSGSTGNFRVFTHAVSGGSLTIQNLGVTGGRVYQTDVRSIGGCLYSKGNVILNHVDVSACKVSNGGTFISYGGGVYAMGSLMLNYSTVSDSKVSAKTADARGGGVYAKGTLTLEHASLSANSAAAGTSAGGGGAYAFGELMADHATVSGNSATSYSGGTGRGGGVYAKGVLQLQYSSVSGNTTYSSTGSGTGGGVYAVGNLTLTQTIVSGNHAGGLSSNGAGAHVSGNFASTNSTISDNKAYGGAGQGAGLALVGTINTIATSTISGNVAYGTAGGVVVFGGNNPATMFQMSNSTISNNRATNALGGLYVDSAITKFYNSTIAFNTSGGSAPGVGVGAYSHSVAVTLHSTLMSNNTDASFANENDLTTFGSPGTHLVSFNAAPSKSFIRTPAAAGLPSDVVSLVGLCPHLGALRDNGGLTLTHALMSGSLAIDAGDDVLGALTDQRGPFLLNGERDYTRFSGVAALADIGAYEVQQDDIVFNSDLEGCPI